jgi:cell division protein FtsW
MGTAIVVCLAMGALFIAAGVPTRHLLTITGALIFLALVFAIAAPYRRARLMSFIHPWHDSTGAGFQTVQSMIAIGSGGFFGVGLGESVQKIFYLPEAHTDMILAIIGEELGIFGITAVAALYGMIAYAGLRAAKLARERYAKLLAVGVTSLILCQAVLNFFAVMGLAPLTGVPLPFISYGNSNLIVLLGGMGLLLNVAADGAQARAGKPLRAIEGGRGARAASGNSRGRDGGSRRAGARGRGRATG